MYCTDKQDLGQDKLVILCLERTHQLSNNCRENTRLFLVLLPCWPDKKDVAYSLMETFQKCKSPAREQRLA